MKKLVLLILLFTTSRLLAQSPLFDDTYLHEIRVTSTETDLWDLMTDDFNNNYPNVPYRNVTVEIDGNILENVGIRQKGYSSYFLSPTNKKSIKINFGKFVSDQRYDKVKIINLANGVGDPAIVKDKIAYDMFRMHGVPAPRVSHAKIFIQDVFWGTYAIIEQVDKRYLKRNYASKSGNLWKNKGWSNLEWKGSNSSDYKLDFELQTNETEDDWTKFIDFIDFINHSTNADFKEGIEDLFDLDEYLRILAIDILLNNWDSYIEHGRNWYLYHNPKTDKIHWIPWDYNFSFDRDPSGSVDFPIILNNNEKVLIKRIQEVPEFKERYLNYMCEILAVNFTQDRINPILDQELDLIDDDWDAATNNFFDLSDLQDEINGDTWSFNDVTFQGLKKFIEDRTIVMESQITGQSYICLDIPTVINSQDIVINEFMAQNMEGSSWFDQDNENDDWIELYNNTNNPINLSNYFLSDSSYFLHKWEFPDVTIAAHDYLIVWADKDPLQAGLHTKFNLDKDGDELFLSYIDGTLIDSVDYTELQEENKSLSRIPNGTGDFIVADVTFDEENKDTTGIADILSNQGIIIYPNPADTNLSINFSKTPASSIIIDTLLGQEVYRCTNDTNSLTIDISNLAIGVYQLSLISNSYTITKKIIIK